MLALEHDLAVCVCCHLIGRVQAELRPLNGLTRGIGLLHEQAVLDVRDEQARGELSLEILLAAGEVIAEHVDRVVRIRVGDGTRRCVVDGHRVLGILAGITAQQVVVLGDVTGQILNLYLVLPLVLSAKACRSFFAASIAPALLGFSARVYPIPVDGSPDTAYQLF